ncbi:MAG: calcium/sodium antiporter [Pirellulaceae bacterium]|nr:calcium/sodium antiporter [Pirellulaceae bacterium]
MTWAWVSIVGGLILLVAGGELLVRGASTLAYAMRIPPLVIGLTVVAFGTSAPELAVSVQSALAGDADIALGNVVGSNILNVLLILGASAMIIPLVVSSQLIRRDVPLMVAASVLMLLLGLDGSIGRVDGVILFGGLLVFTFWCVREGRRATAAEQAEFQQEMPKVGTGRIATLKYVALITVGLVMLGFGATWLIAGAVAIATHWGVSKLIISLTIVAAGTSLPEIVTSIIAAWRGERDIAVGNVVGSNLFNILCVLGLTGLVAPVGIEVPSSALQFDIPVMIAAAVACLPVFFTGHVISRWEGGMFFAYYLIYTAYLVLEATASIHRRAIADVMVSFVIPLTIVTLLITVYRYTRSRMTTESD